MAPAAPESATAASTESVPAEPMPTIRRLDHPEPEPVDLVGHAGAPVAKRLVPIAVGGLLLFLFVRGWRRRHRG
jgi:hypothetical protein